MSSPGKLQRNSSGRLNTRNGRIIRNSDAASVCCCDQGPPTENCYYYARRCYDNAKTGWSIPCPMLGPLYARKESNNICYKFVDPPIETPGTDFGASHTLTDCSDVSC